MSTQIKFCGLVREQDVRFAASMGVDALGLVFYPKSPRYLSLEEAIGLRRAMPSSVKCVGLFVNADPQWIHLHQRRLGLDVLQFHGDETADHIRCIMSDLGQETESGNGGEITSPAQGPVYWRAIRMQPGTDLLESNTVFHDAQALLLDAFSESFGGSGKRFDWSLAKALPGSRMILSGGLDEKTVGSGIAELSPMVVDVSSGIQGADPRIKSAQRMEQFVAAVKAADSLRARR